MIRNVVNVVREVSVAVLRAIKAGQIHGIVGYLIRGYIFLFEKSVGIGIIAVVLSGISAASGFFLLVSVSEKPKLLTYSEQLQELDRTSEALSRLGQFVQDQKKSVTEAQALFESYRQEQAKIKTLVDADRKTVEALLMVYEERLNANASSERFIGFGLGVLASIVATFVVSVFVWIVRTLWNRGKAVPAVEE